MFKKCFRLTYERQEFRQQNFWIIAFKNINITGTDTGKVSYSNLTLVCPTLAKQHLPRFENAGKSDAVSHIPPTPDSQIFRLDVLKPDIALIPIRKRITAASLGQTHNVTKLDSFPTGLQIPAHHRQILTRGHSSHPGFLPVDPSGSKMHSARFANRSKPTSDRGHPHPRCLNRVCARTG